MKNTVKKFAAWLLTFMMLFSSMPTGSLAAIITVRQDNEIIDVSNSIQVYGDLVTSTITSSDKFSVVVTDVGENLPKGGEVQFRKLNAVKSVAPATENESGDGRHELGRFDISIKDAAGNEWQPENGETVDVAVRLGKNSLPMTEGAKLYLIHYGKNGAEEVPATFYTANGAVTGFDFTADGFSVYALVESQEQDPNARLFVYFKDGTDTIAEMSITPEQYENGQMNVNIYDPHIDLDSGEVFKGWIQDKQEYTVDDAEDPNVKKDIEGVRSVVRQAMVAGVTDGDSLTFYAMIYKSYHISYIDELGVTIFTDEAIYKDGDTEVPYTIQYTYTPYYVTGSDENDETKAANFDGWGRITEISDHPVVAAVYDNGEEINLASIDLSTTQQNLMLMAQVAYGHWLVFNENMSGASYTEPLFVGTDETPVTAGMPNDPTCTGYHFAGWYLDAECSDDNAFNPTESINETTNVFAKWRPDNETSFSVLIWQEKLSGGYDFVRSITVDNAETGSNMVDALNATTGQSTITVRYKDDYGVEKTENVFIPYPDGTEYNNTDYSGQLCEGFKYETYTTNNEGKVAANGSSVLNVYFVRRTYTLKFYYGAKTSGGSWRIAHNNNNSAYTWGEPSGFTPGYSGELTTGSDSTGDGKVNGGTYYYAAITAKYGADISNEWPGYGDFNDNHSGSNYLNSWILMPGAKARTGNYGGNITIKGKITLMDEQLVGNLANDSGYVVAQYNTIPNEYKYYIYFKDADGDRTYNGTKYKLKETVDVRSGSEYANQHAPSYRGYLNIGNENNGVTTRPGREIYYFYDPISYPILFMDGVYEDGSHNPLDNKNSNTLRSLQEEDAVEYGADVSQYNSFDPTSLISDGSKYVFLGWYSDDQCTDEGKYTFETMPEGGITVYAKWVLKEYKVTLNPNEDRDPSFRYVNDHPAGEYGTNGDVFYVNNGDRIGNVGGTRDAYDLIGWFANEGLTKVWDFGAFALNDTIVNKYGELYARDGSDSRYNPAYPGTMGEINLYASWRKILDGADGIEIVYTATGKDDNGNVVNGTNAPNDPNLYSDKAQAIARPAATAPVAAEGETQYAFQYWVIQDWNGTEYVDTDQKVYPGDRYTVNYEDAYMHDVVYEVDPITGETVVDKNGNPVIKSATYTLQLRAHYSAEDEATETHIYWYNNYLEGDPDAFVRKDEDLTINSTVAIPDAPTREGYIFLGWAKRAERDSETGNLIYIQNVSKNDLFLTYNRSTGTYTYNTKVATGVFADETKPYDGLYAVWAQAKLKVTKIDNTTEKVKVGDVITYTVTVENTGDLDVTGITMADSLVTLNVTAFDLAVGEKKNDITYNYTVTQADVDAGKIDNTATATGKDPDNNNVTASDDCTVTTVEADASIDVVKTADKTSGVEAGDVITYTITVTNDGNVTLTGVVLEEALAGVVEISALSATTLAPEATATASYKYTVTQADVDAGKIVNTVTATGNPPTGEAVTDTATVTVTTVEAESKLSITKDADPTSGVKVGDMITYTVVVTNEGNVTVTAGKLVDDHADLSGKTFELAPGKSATFTYTYTVKQADVDAGKIVNVVKANATAARGKDPDEVSATATVTMVDAESKLSITKSADPTSGVNAGDTITYTVVVTNEGNVTVTAGKLVDDHADLSGETFELAPGKSATFTYTYTVKQADVDAGKIVNVVKANATAARGKDPDEVSATATVTTVDAESKLSITKDADPTSGVKVGDMITYTVVVTNEGNVTVTAGKLVDDHADLSGETFELAPGKSATFTYTYTVKQADVDAGKIVNVVTANATAARGKDPDEVSATATVTTVDAESKLSITKAADPTSGVNAGDTITYTVVVTNEGNVTVTAGKLVDDHADLSGETFELAPGKGATFTYTYTVKQADVDAGKIVNVVKANATAARGKDPEEVSATATVTAEQNGHLTVTKETTSETPEGGYKLGETVSYKITVVNDGNLTITDIKVLDERTGDEWLVASLAPGESAEFTASTTVTEGDILSGHIINEATATGKSPDPDKPDVPVTPDETDDDPEDPNGHLTVTKETTSETPEGGYKLGETVSYKITVVNDGNLTITDIKVLDERTGDEWPVASLAPGESKEFTASTTVTEGDILDGHIINEATATGKSPDPDKPDVPVTPDETDDDPEDPNGHITIVKEATSTPEDEKGYAEGEIITYKITATNDGNLTITDITVTDDLTGDKWPVESLKPGESKEFTAEYTVTAKDAAAGEVLNVATATGKSPDPEKPDVPVTPGEDPEPTVETKFTLIIRYWIGSTEGELINTVTRVEKAGTEYDVVTPPMEGYTADIAEIKGVLEKDTEYDVVYTPEDYTLTILYRFQDGTEAAETYTEVLHFGDEYSVESPVIQTYFANKQKVEGVMPARDVTVTVIYAKYPVIITIDDFETPLGLGLGSINVGETIE